ncbi:MAG: glycosyltransferase [Rhodobacteraceae bacterium]|nr:glycosyltransferase [Paracoccaceae bacterium]
MTRRKKPSICFVTNELYPLRKGGIGRMLYNFARHNALNGSAADIHFLVPPDLVAGSGDLDRLRDALGDMAELHVATPLHTMTDGEAHMFDRASFDPWSLELLVSTSYRYYRALIAIEEQRNTPFDFIEFPDFGGWGLASIEAKRAGMAFQDTLLTARLHSTQGMIARAERFYESSRWSGLLMDAERHLLAHADVVIGHIGSIIEQNGKHYGLSDRWNGRTVLEFPPIMLEQTEIQAAESSKQATQDPADTDYIFSSRLQPFKRPDIFIRAAIAFLEKHPDHRGLFRIVSYGWDRRYIDWLVGLVPDRLRQNILFIEDATEQQRSAFLARSVVVVPSDYESLCLFAFESAQMRRPVLLNARCSAFGDSPRWIDTQNCLLFEGSIESLVEAMERARTWRPTLGALTEVDTPYWLETRNSLVPDVPQVRPAAAGDSDERASLSLMFCGITNRRELQKQLMKAAFVESRIDPGGRDQLVILIPHGLLDPAAPEIRAIEDRGWMVMWSSGTEECPEAFGLRLAGLTGDCVLACPVGYDIHPGFLATGLRAMRHDPDLMICAGHVAVDDPDTGRSIALRAYGGEMPSHALTSSRIAPITSLLRRALLKRRRFDPRAGKFWFEVFLRDCAIDRESILIMPLVAASISGNLTEAAETTARISAGVVDRAGMQAEMPARLLALDPVQGDDEFFRAPRIIQGNALAGGRRLRPEGVPRTWEPVQYLPEHLGLMVHPLEGGVTVAELDPPPGPVSRIVAKVCNVNDENDGVEAAIACVPRDMEDDWVFGVLEGRIATPIRFAISDWVKIAAAQSGELNLAVASMGPHYRLLLLSRLPANAREFKAHLAFNRISLW